MIVPVVTFKGRGSRADPITSIRDTLAIDVVPLISATVPITRTRSPMFASRSKLTDFHSDRAVLVVHDRSLYWQYVRSTKMPLHLLALCCMKKPDLSVILPVTVPVTFTSSPTLGESRHSPAADAGVCVISWMPIVV